MNINQPKVSIVLLNWNGLQDTVDCLESLKQISYPNYEVIVVDNASEGDDVRVLRERYGDYIHLIENDRNYGFAGGNNIGMREALERRAEYVLLLNNDTVVAPDFLDEMVKAAQAEERIGIVSPRIFYYHQPDKVSFGGGVINRWTGSISFRLKQTSREEAERVDFANGCCMLISRPVLLGVGLLDETFFFDGEDVDICLRAQREGWGTLFVPTSKVWHKWMPAASSRSKSKRNVLHAYSLFRNRFILMERYWTRLQFATSTICYIAILPMLFVKFMVYYRQWDMVVSFARGIYDYMRRR